MDLSQQSINESNGGGMKGQKKKWMDKWMIRQNVGWDGMDGWMKFITMVINLPYREMP